MILISFLFIFLVNSFMANSLIHNRTKYLEHMEIETPLFETADGKQVTLREMYKHLNNGLTDVMMHVFNRSFHLKLASPSHGPPEQKWHEGAHTVFINGYVKNFGEHQSTIRLSYIPLLDTLTGFIDIMSAPEDVFGRKSTILYFDQKELDADKTQNIVYKFKFHEIPRDVLSKFTYMKIYKRQAATRLNHVCPVVVLIDVTFQQKYGNRADGYVQALYNEAKDLYAKEIGLHLQLNRIVRIAANPANVNIQQYLANVAQMVRSGQVDARTTSGTKSCLIHVLSHTSFHPALGLAFVGPKPPPIIANGQPIQGRSESIVVPEGGLCADNAFNMLITTTRNANGEVPQKTAVVTLWHEIGHAAGASHREQCCADILNSLGATMSNLEGNRQLWIQNAQKGCSNDKARISNGVYLRDVMESNVQVGGTATGALGWCVRGMVWRYISENDHKMIKSGCIYPV